MKKNKKVTSFDDHLDEQYGSIGTEFREKLQKEFDTFKIGDKTEIKEAATKESMTTSFDLLL